RLLCPFPYTTLFRSVYAEDLDVFVRLFLLIVAFVALLLVLANWPTLLGRGGTMARMGERLWDIGRSPAQHMTVLVFGLVASPPGSAPPQCLPAARSGGR